MAIIYTYPEINQVEGEDLLLISDTNLHKRPTRSVTVDDLAAYIGTVVGVVQNLQSVLTVGNTYVSPDGYGTFTLNDITNNDGQIKYVNTDEGWGYLISAEEGFNITNGSGTNLMSIYSSGLSIDIGGYKVNLLGTNALTATRNVYFPDASGTLALTSDLANVVYSNQDTDISAEWTFYEDLLIDGSNLSFINNNNYRTDIAASTSLSSNISLTLPSSSGTIALTSDIGGPYLPLTGGTLSGNLAIVKSQPTLTLVDGVKVSYLQNINGSLYYSAWLGDNIFQSNSGQTMVIKQNGNVGIGTSSPSQKLEVSGNSLVTGTQFIGDTFAKIQQASGNLLLTNQSSSGAITFLTNSTERIRINASGNVGIGTTSPLEKLQINSGDVLINNSSVSTLKSGGSLYLDLNTFGSLGGRNFRVQNNGNVHLNIDSTGKVGIGTTSPTSKLHVVGTGSFTGQVTIPATPVASTDAASKSYVDAQVGTADTLSEVLALGNTTGGTDIVMDSVLQMTSSVNYIRPNVTDASKSLYLGRSVNLWNFIVSLGNTFTWSGASEKMRLNSSGNLGIGTTSPAEKLHVNGEVRVDGNDGVATKKVRSSYFSSSQNLDLQSGSSADIILTSDKVGIGTTSPSQKLEVAGNIQATGSRNISASYDANHYMRIESNANGGVIKGTDGGVITTLVRTYGNSYLNGGNVGIGTTSPSDKLHIADASEPVLTFERLDSVTVFDEVVGQINFKSTDSTDNNTNAIIKVKKDSDIVGTVPMAISFETGVEGTTSEAMRIDSSGNVGIGTDSPSKKLDIAGDVKLTNGNSIYWRNAANNADIPLLNLSSNNTFNIGTTSSSVPVQMALHTAGSERMRITSAGNVGIGTTSPGVKLDVSGQIRSNNEFLLQTGTTAIGSIRNQAGALDIRGDSSRDVSLGSVSNPQSLFVEGTNGNVGIGTTSPSAPLHINGGATSEVLKVEATSGPFMRFVENGTNVGFLQFTGSTAYLANMANGDFRFRTNNTDQMILTNQGRLGIGTTSPAVKLHVNDSVGGILRLSDTSATADGEKIGGIETGVADGTFFSGINFFRHDGNDGEIRFRTKVNNINTDVMTIVDGNVGIGTTSPVKKLEVNGTFKATGDSSIDGTGNLLIRNQSTTGCGITFVDNVWQGGIEHISGNLYFRTGGQVDKMTIKTNGNVGIGTTSPVYKLDVRSSGNLFYGQTDLNNNTSVFRLKGNGGASSLFEVLADGNVGIGTTNPASKLHVVGVDGTYQTRIGHSTQSLYLTVDGNNVDYKSSGNSAGSHSFSTGNTERVRITSSGNVGIGTSSPGQELHVVGDIKATNKIFVEDSSNSRLEFASSISNQARISAHKTNLGQTLPLLIQAEGIKFGTVGGGEKMRMDSSGNVGIGTTSPNAKLNVNGDIKIEGENELYFGGSGSVPNWEIKASGSDLVINDTGSNVGSVLFNNDEGIVLPRLTTTEINAISLPNTGLTVYNTTLNTLCFYNGSSWQKVSHTSM